MAAITDLQRLPLNLPDFIALRECGMIYVDKTRQIASLAMMRRQYVFVRPRRFGKSLLISTFEALFSEGLKHFEGLAIQDVWREERYLEVDRWFKTQPRQSLVLLIDEYDAPLTAVIDTPELFKSVRRKLAAFYAVCKSNVAQLRFFFMTGITKFNQADSCSELDDLIDISIDPMYGDIVGVTELEIRKYFSPYLKDAAATLGLSEDGTLQKLRQYYGGYCFDEDASVHVYSPWSVLNFLARPYRGFRSYWIESGGQISLLCRYLKDHAERSPADYAVEKPLNYGEMLIPTGSEERQRDTALLTLAGYLTIKRRELNTFFLGYPNRELEEAMATTYSERLLEGRSIREIGA